MIAHDDSVRQKFLGISFSGGGVHSWTQVAVMESLEKQGIETDAVTGTSMGSFIAAAVASGLSTEEIYEVIRETDKAISQSKLFDRNPLLSLFSLRNPMGFVLMEKLAEVIKPVAKIYSDIHLSDVPKPLAIPAVDIISNKLIVFSNAPEYFKLPYENAEFYDGDIPLLTACLASSAYPIVLSPVELDDYQLVDGGVLLNTPADLFNKDRVEYVLTLGGGPLEPYDERSNRRIDVALRAIAIMIDAQVNLSVQEADQIYSIKLELPGTFDFGDGDRIIEAGREYVKNNPVDTTNMIENIEPKIAIEKPEPFKEKVNKRWQNLKRFFS